MDWLYYSVVDEVDGFCFHWFSETLLEFHEPDGLRHVEIGKNSTRDVVSVDIGVQSKSGCLGVDAHISYLLVCDYFIYNK